MKKAGWTGIGAIFLGLSVWSIGCERRSQVLICEKISPGIANCRIEINAWAPWGQFRSKPYRNIRAVQVPTLNAESTNCQSKITGPGSNCSTNYVKLYPVWLIDRSGQKYILDRIAQNHEPTSVAIGAEVNGFLRSGQPQVKVDISGSGWSQDYDKNGNALIAGRQENMPGGYILGGVILASIGMVFLQGPWVLRGFQMWRMNPELRRLLRDERQ
jgi:hypothetical protein